VSQQDNRSPAELFDEAFRPTLFTPWAHTLLQFAVPQAGERVLDLACGTGTVAQEVAPILGEHG